MNLKLFDIQQYLSDKGISYAHAGQRDVSRGWIGITCLFCEDHATHLGINLSTKVYSCLRCKRKGPATRLVQIFEGNISRSAAEAIMEEYKDPYGFLLDSAEKNIVIAREILPEEIEEVFPQIHKDYLESRGFDPNYLIDKYQLKAVYQFGYWKYRIIIPIYMNHILVGFTSRDITDQSPNRYHDAPEGRWKIDPRLWLYNIDSVTGDQAILLEGPTDVWRMGDDTFCGLGSSLTPEQMLRIAALGLKRLFILYDAEDTAQEAAEKAGSNLSPFIPDIEIVGLPSGDAGDLDDATARKIKSGLFGS